jgi:hypothetical protein
MEVSMQKNDLFLIESDGFRNRLFLNGQGVGTFSTLDAAEAEAKKVANRTVPGASLKFELDFKWTLSDLEIRAATLERVSAEATARRCGLQSRDAILWIPAPSPDLAPRTADHLDDAAIALLDDRYGGVLPLSLLPCNRPIVGYHRVQKTLDLGVFGVKFLGAPSLFFGSFVIPNGEKRNPEVGAVDRIVR